MSMLIGVRGIVARVWAGLGRLLAATKPSQPMGFIGGGLAAGALLGPVAGLLKLLGVLALVWGGAWMWGETRYHSGERDGYARHQAEVAAATRDANARIEALEAELETERTIREEARERAATNAIVGVPNIPRCVQSECALPPSSIAILNGISDDESAKNETYGPLIVR